MIRIKGAFLADHGNNNKQKKMKDALKGGILGVIEHLGSEDFTG